MRVLVACEESQAVCTAFRELCHEAYSCDIIDCSGGHPEWHIKWDALAVINGNCSFMTQDGELHRIDGKWDLIIAHPPCTHLAVSGALRFEKKREDGRQRAAIEFFCNLLNADCEKICVENPVNIISGDYCKKWFPDICEKYGLPIKPTQSVQPYEFGHNASKKTCFWLKGINKLQPTSYVLPDENGHYANQTKDGQNKLMIDGVWIGYNDPRTAIYRSKTYSGIAKAMAEQWGGKNDS